MRRAVRWGLIVLILVALVVVAGISLLRSEWFFQRVRERVVAEMEKATGGRVELQGFHFNWSSLVVDMDGLVIHGTEPVGAEPLFRARKITVGGKLLSLVRRDIDVQFIDVLEPRTNLIIGADGRTNIPEPKGLAKNGKPFEETILDLALGRFSAQNGSVRVTAAGQGPKVLPWSANGRNLKTQFNFSRAGGVPRYTGTVSIQPLEARYGEYALPLPSGVELAAVFERDHIQVTAGKLTTPASQLEFSGDVKGLSTPKFAGNYRAHASAEELGKILDLAFRGTGRIDLSGGFHYNDAADYATAGKLLASDVNYRDRDIRLDHLRVASDYSVDAKKIGLTGIRASGLGGQFQGLATLTDLEKFAVKGRLAGFEFYRVADLVHASHPPLNARFSGPVELRGTLAGLKYSRYDASAKLAIEPVAGTAVSGYLEVHYDGAKQAIQFGSSYLALPASRADFKGTLSTQATAGRAPRFNDAQLQVRLASTDLNDVLVFAPELKPLAVTLDKGHAEFNGTVSGALTSPTVSGHVAANSVMVQKQKVDAFSADVTVNRDGLQLRAGVLSYENMRARIAGSLGLHEWKADNRSAVTATASLQNADIANLLALAGQPQIPVKGPVSAEAQMNGTLADPRATATVRAGKGVAYGEPFDRATANLTYVNGGRQDFTAEVAAGPRKLTLTGNYQPTTTDFLAGVLQARVSTTEMALNQIQMLRENQPTIGGTALGTADMEARLIHPKSGEQFEIVKLNADVTTRNLALEKKPLGDVHLVARSVGAAAQAGQAPVVHVQLDSNLAHSTIHGAGDFKLSGDFPGSGEATFSGVNLAEVRKMFAPGVAALESIGGQVEGKITFKGNAMQPRAMTGTLEIAKLEVRPATNAGGTTPIPESLRDVVIRNEGAIRASMTNGNIRVDSARVTAHTRQDSTDLNLAGTINLNAAAPMNLRASGKLDLSILPMFERDLVSSGTVAASATIRGAFAQPEIAGRLDVTNANLNLEGLPNGLSHANGTVLFDGSRATIQALSAETGGGKVNVTGFASFANGPLAFRLETDAKEVRVRYPEGVSTVADANLRLIGTTERSTLSGTITVLRSAFMPRTDLGSLLATAGAPVQTRSVQTGLVGNMQFDVDVQTAPDVRFQTSLAQGLQADANLRLRGTLSNPVLLGRINISQGDIMFFGNKYTINEGSISFYNPVKLEPVLDISLETRARGVDVTINVTGPATKLNANYRSDPPLQFSDLVALLATGRTPNNPTLAARDTGTPQTWQAMGASALLGEAIANPLAGRLQRFFGVSKIKIDPLLTGVSGNAQARLTIEQNVTPDLTFTYITNVASSTGSAQVIRVEWDFNRRWSAVAVRDEYGYFGIDFQYRKRLK